MLNPRWLLCHVLCISYIYVQGKKYLHLFHLLVGTWRTNLRQHNHDKWLECWCRYLCHYDNRCRQNIYDIYYIWNEGLYHHHESWRQIKTYWHRQYVAILISLPFQMSHDLKRSEVLPGQHKLWHSDIWDERNWKKREEIGGKISPVRTKNGFLH